ncbi:MAG: efflux RND transporter permease subunit [Phycisphaerales bacterium]
MNDHLERHSEHNITNKIVRVFLESNLSVVLILLAAVVGLGALFITPREEDPQIVVPLADIYVNFPGHSAKEVEQLVATPLEKILYQIDGVEYVYSMSREDQAVITVRYYVGEDREKSLTKLYKKIDENIDIVPPGVTGWVVKPVEIDDVPVVTLTLTSATADPLALRRVGEELAERLAAVKNVSRSYVIGGQSRAVNLYMDTERMAAYHVSPLELQRAIIASNVRQLAGDFRRDDKVVRVQTGQPISDSRKLGQLVVGVFDGRPVFLKDVVTISDGPEEIENYVRHGWGPAQGFTTEENFPGTLIGSNHKTLPGAQPAVTIAVAKKKGANAVWVAKDVIRQTSELKKALVPSDMDIVLTRNYGLTADEKVNELVEALAVAVVIVIALLTLALGWREGVIVAFAVPVVFGLTLAVNLMLGFTINRVTLFALILSLGLLVDDPIVDVENIVRHFALRKKATRKIVLDAVSEIRPPLITATLAVIFSFLPMFFITGMMGPYMRPMALNVPVTMLMSMLVAFTITPWLAYHMLKGKYSRGAPAAHDESDPHDLNAVKQSPLYKIFYPLMAPLLKSKGRAFMFLGVMGVLTAGAMMLAATRHVPLKMLPFDNKNELLLVLNFDRGTTLEQSDATVRKLEDALRGVPEVSDFTSYVGTHSPMDFNGLVRHYYLREGDNVAEIRIDLATKKGRALQSHAIGLRIRDGLTEIAEAGGARLALVETPPGPPVLASVVAEVTGQPDTRYEELVSAAKLVGDRLKREPGVVDVDDTTEAAMKKLVFLPDQEKAAINGISVQEIADSLSAAVGGLFAGTVHERDERNPLRIELRLPVAARSSAKDLGRLEIKGTPGNAPGSVPGSAPGPESGALVQLAELGEWAEEGVDATIYHKNLQPVVYVFAETAGRPPADVVVDVMHDQSHDGKAFVAGNAARAVAGRTFFSNGSGVAWGVPAGVGVNFAGEGEWKITLDVFRDLGLAFAAALVGIYILLVAQTGSFLLPMVVMLAIPLTILGVMPGFWLLNMVSAQSVGGYMDGVYFTATGMIGMIALAGIVTRDSIILVDFIHLSLARGRSLFDAIMESRVVRLRPILLTAFAAMLGAVPIIIDPIFSGLAWSLIFGLFASTVFTLFVIPVSYWLLYANVKGHGLPMEKMEE